MSYNIYFIHGNYQASPAPRPATRRAQALTNVVRPTAAGPQRAPQRPPVSSQPQVLVEDVAGQVWSPDVIVTRPKAGARPDTAVHGPRAPSSRYRHSRRDRPSSSRSSSRSRSRETLRSIRHLEPPPGNWEPLPGIWNDVRPPQQTPPTPPWTSQASQASAVRPASAFPQPRASSVRPFSAFPESPDLQFLRQWLTQHQDVNHPIKPEFVSHIASLPFRGEVKPAHLSELRLLDWNTSWTQPQDAPRTFHYDVLPLPHLKVKAGFDHSFPPPPRRALRADQSDAIEHVILTHATSQGGAIQILREAKLRPSRLHFPYSQSFFGLGFRKSNDVANDRYELARILNSSWHASKNTSSLLFVTTAWGQATNVKEGGEGVCVDQTLRGGLVHHFRAKMWVCHVDNHFLSAVAWKSDADSPTGFL